MSRAVILTIAFVFFALALPSEAAPRPAARRALLVGINKYEHVPPLRGCVRDVEDMREVLRRKYGFAEDDILTLTDAQATHENIISAFRKHLIEYAQAHPGAVAVFVYSGHGSTVEDTPQATRASGYHCTIVPVDSRDPAGKHFDILDDELAGLVGSLCQHTSNVTLIFDSCHSGNVTRTGSATTGARSVNRDLRLQPPRPSSGPPAKPTHTVIDRLPLNQRYVVISACQWNEVAQEGPVGNDAGGALIGNLVPALWRARADLTCRELFEEVSTAVTTQWVNQHPRAESDLHRVFLGSPSGEDPFIALDRADGTALVVRAGASQGLRTGMLLAVYAPQAMRLVGSEHRLATAVVTEVAPFSATARMPGGQPLPRGAKVVVVTPLLGNRLRLSIETGDAQLDAALRARLQGDGLVEIASPADLKVVRGRFRDLFPHRLDAAPGSDGASENVLSIVGAGRPVCGFFTAASDPGALDKIQEALKKFARQRNLAALTNSASKYRDAIGIRVFRVRGHPEPNFGFRVESEEPAAGRDLDCRLPVDSYFKVELENRSAVPLYFTLFDLGADGSVHMMFPPSGHGELFPPGKRVKLPEVFQVTPPLGQEVLKVIATTRPTAFDYLVQAAATRTAAARAPQNLVEQLIGRAFGQTRDLVLQQREADDWTTSQTRLIITEP